MLQKVTLYFPSNNNKNDFQSNYIQEQDYLNTLHQNGEFAEMIKSDNSKRIPEPLNRDNLSQSVLFRELKQKVGRRACHQNKKKLVKFPLISPSFPFSR